MKASKIISLALCTAIMMVGCGKSSSSAPATSEAPTQSSSTSSAAEVTASSAAGSEAGADTEKLVFEYFNTSMTVEWIQHIDEALRTLGEEYNFEVLNGDASRDINTQLSQVDTAIDQGIDGAFLFVVDEGSATAVVDKFNEAGIPVIGETLKLKDGEGNNIAPYVELDAFNVGKNCGEWVVANKDSVGVDLSDVAKVGVIQNTNSKYQSDLVRIEGFMSGLEALGVPEGNVFMADCAAEASSSDNTEASYNQVSAILSAHPDMTAWIVMGSVDSYAMGAARAIEAAGMQDKAVLVSAGGELAIQEWANGSAPEWKATCYYDAMDFAEQMVAGMLAITREGKTASEIYPEFQEEGQSFAAVKISGNMATPDTYKEVVGK